MKRGNKLTENELIDLGYQFVIIFGHTEVWTNDKLSIMWNPATLLVEFVSTKTS